jgi:hypothetical protein
MLNLLNSYQRARLLLLIGWGIAFVVFWFGGRWVRVPEYPEYQASLFLSDSVGMPLVVVAVMFFVCMGIGTAVAGMVRFNAGVLTAALGLMALSARGGSPRQTILWAISTIGMGKIFGRLVLELLALTVIIGAAWWVLRFLYSRGKLRDRETGQEREGEVGGAIGELSSLAVQFLVTALGVMLIAQSEAKQQVMAAIFIASWGGAIVAHMSFGTGARGWYWLPPLLVGLFGYVLAWLFEPAGLAVADFRGVFAGLYRPMPLDYASMGPAGAIVGHWMSRRWQRDKESPVKLAIEAM